MDLRRQHTYQSLPTDKQRPKGWRIKPSRTGFTVGEAFTVGGALTAADNGCSFLAFATRILHIPGSKPLYENAFKNHHNLDGLVIVLLPWGYQPNNTTKEELYSGTIRRRT